MKLETLQVVKGRIWNNFIRRATHETKTRGTLGWLSKRKDRWNKYVGHSRLVNSHSTTTVLVYDIGEFDFSKFRHGSECFWVCRYLYQRGKLINDHHIAVSCNGGQHLALTTPVSFLQCFKVWHRMIGGVFKKPVVGKTSNRSVRRVRRWVLRHIFSEVINVQMIRMHVFPATLIRHDKHSVLELIYRIASILSDAVPEINISHVDILVITVFNGSHQWSSGWCLKRVSTARCIKIFSGDPPWPRISFRAWKRVWSIGVCLVITEIRYGIDVSFAVYLCNVGSFIGFAVTRRSCTKTKCKKRDWFSTS